MMTSAKGTFRQGYTMPGRHPMAQARPFGTAYHLPKAPAVQRSVCQVGLGTARNFHSARPIFQNLVDNVPIAARAFCEADWEIKDKREARKPRLSKKRSSNKGKKASLVIKPIEKKVVEVEAAELDHYFAAPVVAETTTYLLVPLAPTPTARNPLPASPSPSLLPISVLLDIHSSHELHSLRVSSLFARLDASQVWTSPGVSCSAYGDPSGLASILKIEFRGWTEFEVRAILGEAGTGWCVLEEETSETETENAMSPSLSGVSTPLTGIEEEEAETAIESFFSSESDVDPSHSLIIPSLDLSNHLAWSESSSIDSVPSPLMLPSQTPPDVVFDYDSDGSLESYSQFGSDNDESVSWMMMSVSSRVNEDEEGPREYMF